MLGILVWRKAPWTFSPEADLVAGFSGTGDFTLGRVCSFLGRAPAHVHVGLKGPSPSMPGVPRTRVAQQSGSGAWSCGLRTSVGIGGALLRARMPSPRFVLRPSPPRAVLGFLPAVAGFPSSSRLGGGLLEAYHKIWPFRPRTRRMATLTQAQRPLSLPTAWRPLIRLQERSF